MTTPSMSNGALDSTAILKKSGSNYELTMNFGPTYQYTVYGHLEDFYIYKGSDVNEGKTNMTNDKGDGTHSTATEAVYSNWYKGYSSSSKQDFAKNDLGEDKKTDEYDLPGTVTVTLPYIGTSNEKRSYWVGMTVDAMGGYASAILMLSWGTLTATEDVHDTLSLSQNEVGLSLYDDGSKTEEVTATVIGSSEWTISCAAVPSSDSQSSDIADVSVTGNTITFTAKKVGTCDYVVTAQKDGETDLSQTITVTVTDQKPASVTATASNGTASISITGSTLIGAGDVIEVSDSKITINAKTSDSSVDGTQISVAVDTMKVLAAERKSVAIVTDVGTITLDADAVLSAANSGQEIKLTMDEVAAPDIDGLDDSDFDAAYELTLRYGSSSRSDLGGDVTITVPWSGSVGYAYYVDGDELAERYTMTVGSSTASWVTDHFSTWALSTDRNLMEVGITEGVYSVPIVIKQADAPSRDSMANDATGDMVVADVDEDGVTYTMFLKARIGDELGGDSLRGHLLKMWYYAPDDTSLSNPIRATVVRTYQDKDR